LRNFIDQFFVLKRPETIREKVYDVWFNMKICSRVSEDFKTPYQSVDGFCFRIVDKIDDVQDVLTEAQKLVVHPLIKIPPLIAPNFSDPSAYSNNAYDLIESAHEETYLGLVASLPDTVHVIAPGDGTGVIERICAYLSRSCTSGDLRTNEEKISVTIARGLDEAAKLGKKPLSINAFISVFIDEWPDDLGTIWIDTIKILGRHIVIPCSPTVYFSGMDAFNFFLPFDPFRETYKYHRPPYFLEIQKLPHITVGRVSLELIHALKYGIKAFSSHPLVAQFIRGFGMFQYKMGSVHFVTVVADFKREFYFVPIGKIVTMDEVVKWDGHSPLQRRRVYEVDELVPLPEKLSYGYQREKKYCWYSDEYGESLSRAKYCSGNSYGDVQLVEIVNYHDRKLGHYTWDGYCQLGSVGDS